MPDHAGLDVVTVGEAMALLIAQQAGALETVQSFARATAGAELNVAVGLARLGLRVAYVSRLGDDSFGRHLRAFMAREAIDIGHVATDPLQPTGFMLKSRVTDGGDPSIEYYRRGSAASHLGPQDFPFAAWHRVRHVHLTGISPGVSESLRELVFLMARTARQEGRTVSFDPNLRPRLWPSEAAMRDTLNALAAHADWVLPGLAEGRLLTGADSPEGIADFYLARGTRVVIVKLGPAGAYYADSQGQCGTAAGVPVPCVVDTVGAGDGFAVGVISALLEGRPLAEAARRGNRIGARVVQFPGDCDGLPTRQELQLEALR
ncbi:2-dehydro-3-deoxygluconokinase [Sphaerotilus hippei]|uniref:2-dehydro-3-deoxygluconokinase n=1 Tax=Sphaerotilus hippei TaxID=744406 RepID=A0A318H6U1_9BURK|nr:sugar kinase [Sphaerotilus hippei]PXW95216.1 2-dehydro-3-deoxygluconokinase [Sphaerotilus hippei]